MAVVFLFSLFYGFLCLRGGGYLSGRSGVHALDGARRSRASAGVASASGDGRRATTTFPLADVCGDEGVCGGARVRFCVARELHGFHGEAGPVQLLPSVGEPPEGEFV